MQRCLLDAIGLWLGLEKASIFRIPLAASSNHLWLWIWEPLGAGGTVPFHPPVSSQALQSGDWLVLPQERCNISIKGSICVCGGGGVGQFCIIQAWLMESLQWWSPFPTLQERGCGEGPTRGSGTGQLEVSLPWDTTLAPWQK